MNRPTAIVRARSRPTSGDVQFEHFRLGRGSIEVAWGYRRCRARDRPGGIGQDYAAVQADASRVVGVVADGVGQSFRGDLAATAVAGRLLTMLWNRRSRPPGRDDLLAALSAWTPQIRREVERTPGFPDLPPLLQRADEESRSQGSQTVFSAFVYDGLRDVLHLYHVGDAPAVVWLSSGDPLVRLGPPGGRWSSAGNSDLQLLAERISGVRRCVVHSDGLGHDWFRHDQRLDRRRFKELAAARSELDDVSFVSVRRLRPPRPPRRWPEIAQERKLENSRGAPSVKKPPPIPITKRPRGGQAPRVALFLLGSLAGVLLQTALQGEISGPTTSSLDLPQPREVHKPPIPPIEKTPPEPRSWSLTAESLLSDPPEPRVHGAQALLVIEAPPELTRIEACWPVGPRDTESERFPPLVLGADTEMRFVLRGVTTEGGTGFEEELRLPSRAKNHPDPGQPTGIYRFRVSK